MKGFNEEIMNAAHYDVAIIGGGPAGLQAALILARTRKRVIVFDSPELPRNAASHGVHNFVGLDGLLPTEIREQAWKQIAVYNSVEQHPERVVDVQSNADNSFSVTGEAGASITARHVILALGYRDVYPDAPGFMACWGDTIIACPYCDGYENRDRVWGLVVSSQLALEHMPHIFRAHLYRNWTAQIKLIIAPQLQIDDEQHTALTAQGITIHEGDIVEIHHTAGKVEAVTLSTGEQVAVGTLWWRLDETPQPKRSSPISVSNWMNLVISKPTLSTRRQSGACGRLAMCAAGQVRSAQRIRPVWRPMPSAVSGMRNMQRRNLRE
jgi:thioredoxin reductase